MKAQCRAANREMIKPAAAITSRSSRPKRQQEPDSSDDSDSDTTDSSDGEMVLADTTSCDSDAISTDFTASTTDVSDDEEVTYRKRELRALLKKPLRRNASSTADVKLDPSQRSKVPLPQCLNQSVHLTCQAIKKGVHLLVLLQLSAQESLYLILLKINSVHSSRNHLMLN